MRMRACVSYCSDATGMTHMTGWKKCCWGKWNAPAEDACEQGFKRKKIGSLSPSNCLLCLLSQWLFVTVRKWAWIVAFESKLAEWIRLLVSLLWSQFVSVVTATPHNQNTKHLCLLKSLLVNRLIPPTQLKGSSINFTHLSEFTDLMKYSCICRGKQKCIKPFLAPEKLHVIW